MIETDCFMIVKNRAGAVDEFYVVDFGWMFGTPRIPTLPYCEFTDNYMWNVFGASLKMLTYHTRTILTVSIFLVLE